MSKEVCDSIRHAYLWKFKAPISARELTETMNTIRAGGELPEYVKEWIDEHTVYLDYPSM